MLKYIFLLCVSCHAFSQVQSLPEYNRSLLAQLVSKKALSPKEFKALRIRLGADLTSADDNSYKENELLKLLEYATFSAYLSKSKSDEDLVRDMWKRYLTLPNTTNKVFEVSYISSLLPDEEKDPSRLIEIYDYFLRFTPKDKNKQFFLPLVASNCTTLTYLKKTDELERCWKLEYDISDGREGVFLKTASDRLTYYAGSYPLKKDFKTMVAKILADKKMEPIHLYAKFLTVEMKIKDLDFQNVEKEIERLKIVSQDKLPMEKTTLRYLLAQNKLDKAVAVHKTLSQNNLTPREDAAYNQLSTELYFKKGEYQKADYYITKLIENETRDLAKLAAYAAKAAIAIIIRSTNPMEEFKKNIKDCEKIIAENKITSQEYLTLLRVAKILSAGSALDLAELKKATVELKKYNYPAVARVSLLDKVISEMNDRQK